VFYCWRRFMNIATTQTQFICDFKRVDSPIKTVRVKSYLSPRKWQKQCFKQLKASNHRKLNGPTGCGKSAAIKMLCLHDNRTGFKNLIAVSLKSIGKSFSDITQIKMPNGEMRQFHVSHINNLIANQDTNNTLVQQVIQYLTTGLLYHDDALLCTHATLSRVYAELERTGQLHLFDNCSIFIDEAHHVQHHEEESTAESAEIDQLINCLGRAVKYWVKQANIRLTLVTGTWFRGDKTLIIPDNIANQFESYNLPFDQYLKEMIYLKKIVLRTHFYKNNPGEVLSRELKGDCGINIINVPPSMHSMYKEMQIDKYQFVDNIKKNISLNTWTLINGVHYCHDNGNELRLVDLVDDRADHKQCFDFLNTTGGDRTKCAQFLVNMYKFSEGADFPVANRCWIIGHRMSLVTILQMIGRLLRDVEGKENIEINLVLSSDIFNDKNSSVNQYWNAIALSMLLENIFSPPTMKSTHNKHVVRYLDIFESEKQWFDFISEVHNQLITRGTSDYDNVLKIMNAVAKKQHIDSTNLSDLIISVKLSIANRMKHNKGERVLNGIFNKVELDLIDKFDILDGIETLTSHAITNEIFQKYRDKLRDTINFRTNFKERLDQIQLFLSAHHRYPLSGEQNGKWLIWMRETFSRDSKRPTSDLHKIQVIEYANSLNMKNIFDYDFYITFNRIVYRIDNVIKFIKQNKRRPRRDVKTEQRTATQLLELCGGYHGTGRLATLFKDPLIVKQIDMYLLNIGHPNLFQTQKSRALQKGLINTQLTIDFFKRTGKYLNRLNATSPREVQLAYWLEGMVKIKNGKKRGFFFPQFQTLAEQHNVKDLFNNKRDIQHEKDKNDLIQIIQFIQKNKRSPSRLNNGTESKFAVKLQNLRVKWDTNKLHPEISALCIQYNMPLILHRKRNIEEKNEKTA